MPHPYHRRRSSESRLQTIVDYLDGDPAGLRVLELGALDGWFSHRLAEKGAECVAVDDDPALTAAPGVTVINERLTPGKIRDLGDFDVVICLSVLHHVKPWRATLNALLLAAPLVFVETANPEENLPKAVQHHDSLKISAAVEKAGGVVLATHHGYDRSFTRPLWVVDNCDRVGT